MRTIVNLLLLAAVGVVGYIVIEDYYFPCREPLTYEVGQVDPQFNISKERVVELAKRAESIWENAVEKDLFTYTQGNGEIEISLVFDERQQDTHDARAIEEQLDAQARELEVAEEEYETLAEQYKNTEREFLAHAKEFNERRQEFDRRVEEWNSSDRTDESELRALEEEEQALSDMQAELLEEEEALNALHEELGRVLERRNNIASEYNSNVGTYNERFGEGGTFDQGQYDGSDTEITVYQFDNETDLTLVIAHEFGHALGIGHVDDPAAVMYYLMREQLIDPIRLTDPDISALETACRL